MVGVGGRRHDRGDESGSETEGEEGSGHEAAPVSSAAPGTGASGGKRANEHSTVATAAGRRVETAGPGVSPRAQQAPAKVLSSNCGALTERSLGARIVQ
jgi:hypothetical protein